MPANDNASKTDRIIAFTDIEVTSFYAVKFAIAKNSIDILGKHMPIRIIVDWESKHTTLRTKKFHGNY